MPFSHFLRGNGVPPLPGDLGGTMGTMIVTCAAWTFLSPSPVIIFEKMLHGARFYGWSTPNSISVGAPPNTLLGELTTLRRPHSRLGSGTSPPQTPPPQRSRRVCRLLELPYLFSTIQALHRLRVELSSRCITLHQLGSADRYEFKSAITFYRDLFTSSRKQPQAKLILVLQCEQSPQLGFYIYINFNALYAL